MRASGLDIQDEEGLFSTSGYSVYDHCLTHRQGLKLYLYQCAVWIGYETDNKGAMTLLSVQTNQRIHFLFVVLVDVILLRSRILPSYLAMYLRVYKSMKQAYKHSSPKSEDKRGAMIR